MTNVASRVLSTDDFSTKEAQVNLYNIMNYIHIYIII